MDTSTERTAEPRRTPVSLFAPPEVAALDAPPGCRAIIASGLRLLREGLADALARSTTITVMAVAADAEHACAAVAEHRPDVLLLDIEMAESLDLIRAVRELTPAPKLVAFAVSDAENTLVSCIEAGIDGFVTRDGSLSDVVAAVESVGRGETIMPPRLAASLFQWLAGQRRGRNDDVAAALTAREQQILTLLEQGMANKEIARVLGIEVATVKNHVHHVLEKLKVSRRGQAAARARDKTKDGVHAPSQKD